MLASVSAAPNRRVYLDICIGEVAQGRIVVELLNNVCPITCDRFAKLCGGDEAGSSYEGTNFHRVIKGFMCQGGSITGPDDEPWEDENFSVPHNMPGLLSMANKGPNTNGTQFFLTTKPAPHLDGLHVCFGRVLHGMPILKRMEKASTDSDDRPTDPIVVVGCGVLAEGEAAGYVDLVGKAAQEAAGPAGFDPGFDLSMLKGGAKMLFRAQLFWQEVRTLTPPTPNQLLPYMDSIPKIEHRRFEH